LTEQDHLPPPGIEDRGDRCQAGGGGIEDGGGGEFRIYGHRGLELPLIDRASGRQGTRRP
jgi:hypothetical protein